MWIELNLKIIDKSMTDIAEDLLTEVNHALNDRHMTPQLQQRRCFCKSYTFSFKNQIEFWWVGYRYRMDSVNADSSCEQGASYYCRC